MKRLKPFTAVFFLALVGLLATPSFGSCVDLLHANYRALKLDFGGEPLDEGVSPPSAAIGKDDDHLYVANAKVFGEVDTRTGRVEPIYRASAHDRLGVLMSNDAVVSVSVTSEIGAVKAQYFLERRTGLTRKIPLPKGAVIDPKWTSLDRPFFPYAVRNELRVYDFSRNESRTHALPFAPDRIFTLGESGKVALVKEGRPVEVIDLETGAALAIPGLERFRISSDPARGYDVRQRSGNRLYLSHYREGVPASEGVIEVDVRARKFAEFSPPVAGVDFVEAVGEYFVFQRPEGGADGFMNRQLLFDRRAGKVLADHSYISVSPTTRGHEATISIAKFEPMPEYPDRFESKGIELFRWDSVSGNLMKLVDGKEASFASGSYDPKTGNWMVSVYPHKAQSDTRAGRSLRKPYLVAFDATGKRVHTFENASIDFAHGEFLGFYGSNFNGGPPLYRVYVPDFVTQPQVPAEAWDSAAKILAEPMTEAEAKANYPTLMAFFETGTYRKFPDLASAAFLNLFATSNGYSGRLLERFTDLEAVLARNPIDLGRMNAARAERWRNASHAYLDMLLLGSMFQGGDIGHMRVMAPFLKDFGPERTEELVDAIAEKAKDRAIWETPELADVFQSKIYKVIRRRFARDFGLAEGPITDATIVQDGKSLTLLALGSERIPGGQRSRSGLDFKVLNKTAIREEAAKNEVIADGIFKWRHAGESFSVKLLARVMDITVEEMIQFRPAPDYAAHWRDGKFTTLVMTGSNLIADARGTMDEYLQYFLDRGYEFGESAPVADVNGYLRDEISAGRIDMFVKEAHSDGDEKNLFRIWKTSEMRVGRKRLPEGREEVVILMYPDASAKAPDSEKLTHLIPNSEFGEWMRARVASGVPFLYLNTSCWSNAKALNEIQESRTSILVDIPSLTPMDEFTNEKTSGMYLLVDGFLNGGTYSQVKEATQVDPGVRAGTSNVALFPDSADPEPYREHVLKGLRVPLDIQVQVFDSQGRPINIDDHPHP